ncbi:hypothetical protein BC332_19205 [Capsicum chinense]|nr:hypothetical protein BC332_19205 [Capsicum chinense]
MDVPLNLVLKASVATHNFEESEIDRIAKRILKALERFGAFSKRGESNGGSKAGKENNTCHKCYNLGHYIKDCPMHKIDYNKYANQDTSIEREKVWDPIRLSKKVEADEVATAMRHYRGGSLEIDKWELASSVMHHHRDAPLESHFSYKRDAPTSCGSTGNGQLEIWTSPRRAKITESHWKLTIVILHFSAMHYGHKSRCFMMKT